MASDFVVIVSGPQHLGDEPNRFPDAQHHSGDGQFPFDCPGVVTTEPAFLMFRHREYKYDKNVIYLGTWVGPDFHPIPGQLRNSESGWTTHFTTIPGTWLKPSGNVLSFGARDSIGGTGGGGREVDDYVIDSVVLFYRARSSWLPWFGLRSAR